MKTRKKTMNAYFHRKQFLPLMMEVLGGDLSLCRVNTTLCLGPEHHPQHFLLVYRRKTERTRKNCGMNHKAHKSQFSNKLLAHQTKFFY